VRIRDGLSSVRAASRLARLPIAERLTSRRTRAPQYAVDAGRRCRRR